jgi:hypothetical protein
VGLDLAELLCELGIGRVGLPTDEVDRGREPLQRRHPMRTDEVHDIVHLVGMAVERLRVWRMLSSSALSACVASSRWHPLGRRCGR